MDLRFKEELASMPDLRHRLRQLRWFRATFRSNASAVAEHYGVRFEIDEPRLTRVFLDWIETVNAHKNFAKLDSADFITFAAGLALKELIRQSPVRLAPHMDRPKAESEIVRFWPEGFLYTNYCVCAIAVLFEQEFGFTPRLASCADDLRTWWSYRENTSEMPASAVAFLDQFVGKEPNWIAPDIVEGRLAMRRALSAPAQTGAIGIEQPDSLPNATTH